MSAAETETEVLIEGSGELPRSLPPLPDVKQPIGIRIDSDDLLQLAERRIIQAQTEPSGEHRALLIREGRQLLEAAARNRPGKAVLYGL